MVITLTPEQEDFIKKQMDRGQFSSPGEVIQVGLQLLKEQETVRELRLEQLRQEVQRAADQIEQGEYREFSSGKEVASWLEAVIIRS